MSEKLNDKIFDNTTLSTLFKDIYENSSKKNKQILLLINELRPLIKDVSEAVMVVPLIKEYMEVAVKNDEQLVKMAGVYQKFVAAEQRIEEVQREKGSLLTSEEKSQLLREIDGDIDKAVSEVKKTDAEVEKAFDDLNIETKQVKEELKKRGVS